LALFFWPVSFLGDLIKGIAICTAVFDYERYGSFCYGFSLHYSPLKGLTNLFFKDANYVNILGNMEGMGYNKRWNGAFCG